MSAHGGDVESDSDGDWEEVHVPEEQKNIEITIETVPNKKSIRISHTERRLRINCHKAHTLALLANAWVRNKWINDPLLHWQARLLSLTPLSLQTALAMIHKSRVPEQAKRGRMFETAMGHLAFWWARTFFDVTFDGHIRNRTFDAVQRAMRLQGLDYDAGEVVRSEKSLMKHALMQSGSRDVSAQLFTALCRGLGVPARLVGKARAEDPPEDGMGNAKAKDMKGKGKAKADFVGDGQRLDGQPSEKAKGKQKAAPTIKLRKAKNKGNVLGSGPASPASTADYPGMYMYPVTTPPVFWTEVFSRPDARWIPVDPIRGLVNQPYAFDPESSTSTAPHASTSTTATFNANPGSAYARPSVPALPPPPRNPHHSGSKAASDNRMVYVLAFEDDGHARDVTRRYARHYAARVVKVQGGQKPRGAAKDAWWARVVKSVARPYRLHRDDVEDAELEVAGLMEGMPTTMGGFKDHPMYVLERHLTQAQTLHPPPPQTRELGKFKGLPVYPRSAVVELKTAENWLRSAGRVVRTGEQPLKMVKVRASTLGRMREVEVMREGLRVTGEAAAAETGGDAAEGGSAKGKVVIHELMQGMYALSQTELYVADPVVDGIIPKNNFGNIDLYVPSMLPAGAVHIPYKGTAKIARKLGFSYAEAVTGFEFKHRSAAPIMEGVVVAAENKDAVLEAYWEAENDAAEKARTKKRERVLKRWKRLVHGLRIRQSLQEEYKDREVAGSAALGEDVEVLPGLAAGSGGGFLTGADGVVEAYQLPKYQHVNLPFLAPSGGGAAAPSGAGEDSEPVVEHLTYDLETMDVDPDPEVDVQAPTPGHNGVGAPKTMKELAAETTARLREELSRHDARNVAQEEEYALSSSPPPTVSASKGKKTRQTKPSRALSERNPVKTKGKAAAAPAVRASTKKRRRNDEKDSDSEEQTEEPSPAKRTKANDAPPAPVRTLRPRRSKTQTELENERAQERAFRNAIAH
ncbi:hypothetical protein C8J57DRAFT_1506245 [Mycena rebaudengoi]|nr:hypothetical protein C8J57DRAFT_1506245 [Mycena rebaudengoi]